MLLLICCFASKYNTLQFDEFVVDKIFSKGYKRFWYSKLILTECNVPNSSFSPAMFVSLKRRPTLTCELGNYWPFSKVMSMVVTVIIVICHFARFSLNWRNYNVELSIKSGTSDREHLRTMRQTQERQTSVVLFCLESLLYYKLKVRFKLFGMEPTTPIRAYPYFSRASNKGAKHWRVRDNCLSRVATTGFFYLCRTCRCRYTV